MNISLSQCQYIHSWRHQRERAKPVGGDDVCVPMRIGSLRQKKPGSVTLEYKVKKCQENTDWESCQSKYNDISGTLWECAELMFAKDARLIVGE